jgi:hypothetical protein
MSPVSKEQVVCHMLAEPVVDRLEVDQILHTDHGHRLIQLLEDG